MQHFQPGGFVGPPKDFLKLGERFEPVPIKASACLVELWESLLKKELNPVGPTIDVDLCLLVAGPLKLLFLGEF